MAVTRTDRDRRILGDRVLAREAEFKAIHPVMAEVVDAFAAQHRELGAATEERLREEGEDAKARRERDEAAVLAQRQYSWAYHQVPQMVGGSWKDEADAQGAALIRERVFPLGAPNTIVVSSQRTLDALIHLAEGMGGEGLSYPDSFKVDVTATRDRLARAIADVTADVAETDTVTTRQLQARDAWDIHWQSLRDISAGFLRLQGQLARHPGLFHSLPRRAGGRAPGEADPSTVAVTPGAEGTGPDGESA